MKGHAFFERSPTWRWFRVCGYGLSWTREPLWSVRNGYTKSWRLGPWWIVPLRPFEMRPFEPKSPRLRVVKGGSR